ncbi:hypothetical protein P8452_43007 [Trifolium repens]|nr:hypothetical protein P8452_43007 [Trifolium repens]
MIYHNQQGQSNKQSSGFEGFKKGYDIIMVRICFFFSQDKHGHQSPQPQEQNHRFVTLIFCPEIEYNQKQQAVVVFSMFQISNSNFKFPSKLLLCPLYLQATIEECSIE